MNEFAPVEMMLMQYAAGSLSPYEALMVAAHLALKPEARKRVSTYEKVGGDLIRHAPPAELKAGCLEKVLSRIETCDEKKVQPCAEKPRRGGARELGIPEPVYALLANACLEDPRCWSKTAGVMKIELRVCNTEPARRKLRLMRLSPSQSTPPHAHAGREITLVLEGGFTDPTGHYTAGDIIIIDDPRFVHSPKADPAGCLFLCLTEAPLRFRDPVAHLMNLLFRL